MKDLIIIGAGPAGLNAAIYAARQNLDALVFERKVPGGAIINTKEIENYLGFSKIEGSALAKSMHEHAKSLGAKIIAENVLKIEKIENGFKVLTNQNTYETKTVLLATGQKPRTLNVENEAKYLGNGISFCATCDGFFYKDLEVAVVGGGNAAVDEATFLADICKKVTVITQDPHLTADKKGQAELFKKTNIEVIYNAKIKKILDENNTLKGINFDVFDQNHSVFVDGIFIFIGQIPESSLLDTELQKEWGYYLVNEDLSTSIPGIFVAGDVRKKAVRQVITAAADGGIAVSAIAKYLKNHG